MRVLVIDTCGVEGSFALADDAEVRQSVRLPGRSASERLLPAVRDALLAIGWQFGDINVIAVVYGPGSFTGIRVGLSAAKGLSDAVGARVLAISRLHVLATLAGETAEPVHAFLDAGRGELFYGRSRGSTLEAEVLLSSDESLAMVGTGPTIVCEASVAEALASITPMFVDPPGAEQALGSALHRIRQNSFDDVATLDGNYVRQTEREVLDRLAARKSAGRLR